jgi:hypothetical protein
VRVGFITNLEPASMRHNEELDPALAPNVVKVQMRVRQVSNSLAPHSMRWTRLSRMNGWEQIAAVAQWP